MRKIIYILLISAIFSACNRKVITSIEKTDQKIETHDSSSYIETIDTVKVKLPADSISISFPVNLSDSSKTYTSESNDITITAEVKNNIVIIKAKQKSKEIAVPVINTNIYKQREVRAIDSKESSYTKKVTPWWVYPLLGLCSIIVLFFVIYIIIKSK